MRNPRLPRFQRSSDAPSMRFADRDRQILRHVHRHKYLRSNHLTSLLPGSQQQILRRLQLLYHHGYLERPRSQINYYWRGGSHKIAYGLGNKGAGLLKRELSLPFHEFAWPRKDNNAQRLFLEHALLVSEFMVALELSLKNHADVRLLMPKELNDAGDSEQKRDFYRWQVYVGNGRTCGVVPDRVFGLEFLAQTGTRERIWFCLEADRGTMPIIRSTLDQSSFYRKMLAYEATWSQNLHRQLFGWARFRVLTLTTSRDRLASMVEATRSLKRGQGLFLFNDLAALKGDILNLEWIANQGRTQTLLN